MQKQQNINILFRIIGLNAMNRYDLRVGTEGYSTEYDPTCNPSIFNEFATAAFRWNTEPLNHWTTEPLNTHIECHFQYFFILNKYTGYIDYIVYRSITIYP